MTQEAIYALAKPLFAEGKSVNAVAAKLEISWYDASKLKKAYEAETAPAAEPEAEQPADEATDEPEAEADSDEDPGWDIPIRIPTDNLDAVFSTFSDEEKIGTFRSLGEDAKAEAIRTVLQARMDAMLAPAEGEAA